MRLKVNGSEREAADGISLEAYVESLNIHRMIVVARNGEVVPRQRYAEITLQEGDELDIAHMVGGG